MKKLPTLEVFIPAFNEEVNIGNLLKSLLNQRVNNFVLKRIIISLDGCTDSTEHIVNDFKKHHQIIKVISNKDRKGKYFRLNEGFRNCTTDILVVLDADIGLVGNNFLENISYAMKSDPGAQMIAAHQVLLRPTGFIERVIYTSFLYWDFVRLSLPNLNTALNYFGSATAYRGSFVRKLKIPPGLLDPHFYIFLMADRMDGFRYCKEAVMRSWVLSTLKDLNRFLKRSIGHRDEKLEKMFTIRSDMFYVAPKYKLIGILKTYAKEPFYTTFALMLSFFMGLKTKRIQHDSTPVWEVLTSTKKAV